MEKETRISSDLINTLLRPCVKILPNGFAIDLSADPAGWHDAVLRHGDRSLCDAAAVWLNSAFIKQYGDPFLFSDSCISYELWYHLTTYLWTQGLGKRRPLSTFLFPERILVRACRSIEIDSNDVYRWSQRIVFRYFQGIRSLYQCTPKDPYACRLFGKMRRIPFFRCR